MEAVSEVRPVGTCLLVTVRSSCRCSCGTTRVGVSNPVSVEVVLDTVAPEVAVTSHGSGDVVDVSDGELAALLGTASDDGGPPCRRVGGGDDA